MSTLTDTSKTASRYAPYADKLYFNLKQVLPWVAKMIADGGHLRSVSPNGAEKALANAALVIARAEGRANPEATANEHEYTNRAGLDFGFFVISGRAYGKEEATTQIIGPTSVTEAYLQFTESVAPTGEELSEARQMEGDPGFSGVFIDAVIHSATKPVSVM